jgi:hypothetical protein
MFLILVGLTNCSNNRSREANKTDNFMEDDPSTILRIISTNPSYIPNKQQQQQAKDFLTKIYPKHKTECISKDKIEFVDQGQNFDSIVCPFCGKSIETEYWQDAMEKADENHFTDLIIITPCCNKHTSLNDLKYITPAGFARFILSVNDPETEIEEENIVALQKILNTQLRIIYAHY